jgi:ribonuclease P protein component
LAGNDERAFRFPRAVRMRRRRDFARTIRDGRTVAREAFVVYCLAVPGKRRLLGVVCGRRVGSAVVRNRVKRHLREIFRTHPEHFRDGLWFVAVAKPPIAGGDFKALEESVLAALAELTRGQNEQVKKSD